MSDPKRPSAVMHDGEQSADQSDAATQHDPEFAGDVLDDEEFDGEVIEVEVVEGDLVDADVVERDVIEIEGELVAADESSVADDEVPTDDEVPPQDDPGPEDELSRVEQTIEPNTLDAVSPVEDGFELEATTPIADVRAARFDIEGQRIQSLSLAKALNAGLRKAMADNSKVILMGEDIGPLGGVFRVTEGLQAEFGSQRVLDTPLAEAGIIGTAIGLAMRGYRPVCEIQFEGFIFPGFDQITTQLAKMTNRHQGALTMPVVVRVPFGGHIGAIEHHQESPEAYFAHTPGLRVVSPSNPNDAYWMIQEAIASNDPIIFFEPKSRYWPKGDVDLLESAVPFHSSRIIRKGADVTVVGYGAMVGQLLHVADLAAAEGTSVEVIDLRSISPIDYAPVLESVRKTGRMVVAQEAPGFVSVSSEIAATVTEKAFYSLEAPVIRVAAFDTPFPPSKVEELYLPDADRVLEAIDRSLAY